MKTSILDASLSRRERQVMELLIKLGEATARDIEGLLQDPPSNSAVRSILRILVGKSLITKRREKGVDFFVPAIPVESARSGVLRALVDNFFASSVAEAACALLGQRNAKLSDEEASRLMKLIREAKRK